MPTEKRSLAQPPSELSKKRAPYALRACDTCRKRKGRCNGHKPCEYCQSRSLECRYALNLDEHRNGHSRNDPTQQMGRDARDSGSERLDFLGELVAGMQGQLNALVAHVKMSSERLAQDLPQTTQSIGSFEGIGSIHGGLPRDSPPADSLPPPPTSAGAAHGGNMPRGLDAGHRTQSQVHGLPSLRQANAFCGPTSPEYSLNAAQRKMQCDATGSRWPGRTMAPSIDHEQSDDEQEPSCQSPESERAMAIPVPMQRPSFSLSQPLVPPAVVLFRTLMPKNEAVRLLHVYHRVIGELHPICDMERLVQQTEACYRSSHAELGLNEPDLLMVNLALAIAICAEAGSPSETGRAIYDACADLVNARLTSPPTGVKHVVAVLLIGVYHFFKAKIRLAWRMCGLAGRLAMELGLHSRDASPDGGEHEAPVVNLICSIIILDRQWSAAAGLPSNFQEADFDPARVSAVDVPYLKSMMAFTGISHKFNEPISQAAQGGVYTDGDSFGVTNFLIDQWIKRTLNGHHFPDPSLWESMPSTIPPAWTIILYLRANAVRSILLRPFFLSDTASSTSRRQIAPALAIITDTVTTLAILDRTTDIYRIQHPFLQHFLAGSCALLFLLLVHTAQNRATIAADLPPDFFKSVNHNFWSALELSKSYMARYSASRKLYRRLVSIKDPLLRVGFLSPLDGPPHHLVQADLQGAGGGPTQQHMALGGNMAPGTEHMSLGGGGGPLTLCQSHDADSNSNASQPQSMPAAANASASASASAGLPGAWNPMFGATSAFHTNFEFSDYGWPSDELANSLFLDGGVAF